MWQERSPDVVDVGKLDVKNKTRLLRLVEHYEVRRGTISRLIRATQSPDETECRRFVAQAVAYQSLCPARGGIGANVWYCGLRVQKQTGRKPPN